MHEKEEPRDASFWPFMFTIFLGSFISVLSSSTITIAMIQWTLTGFMLAMGTIAPLTGYLGERFSFKWLYVASLVGFSLSSMLCGLAWGSRAG